MTTKRTDKQNEMLSDLRFSVLTVIVLLSFCVGLGFLFFTANAWWILLTFGPVGVVFIYWIVSWAITEIKDWLEKYKAAANE